MPVRLVRVVAAVVHLTKSDKKPVMSVIIPTLNEQENISSLLASLEKQNQDLEIIVVDGGSTDRTQKIAKSSPQVQLKNSSPGRALQMNTGAETATSDVLVFLHADTTIPENFVNEAKTVPKDGWAYFNIELSGNRKVYRLIATMMNLRCKLTSVITGDMVLIVSRKLFEKVGGFSDIPIMEDIEISKKLRRFCPPVSLKSTVITSSRRWENRGVLKTILLMWRLRLAYFFGASPEKLANKY